jgi:hypothetical protein
VLNLAVKPQPDAADPPGRLGSPPRAAFLATATMSPERGSMRRTRSPHNVTPGWRTEHASPRASVALAHGAIGGASVVPSTTLLPMGPSIRKPAHYAVAGETAFVCLPYQRVRVNGKHQDA